tara:strand:+ start:789 stop:1061 length:273 start_codon:yes stop_codon:yes gene_type:complete
MNKFNKAILYLGVPTMIIAFVILFGPWEFGENHPLRYLFASLVVLGLVVIFIEDSLPLFTNPIKTLKKNWGWLIFILIVIIAGIREYLGY